MNRNRFLLALTLCSFLGINMVTSLIAGDFPKGSPKFEHSFKAALAEGKKSGKPVIVIFSATWCGPCQAMKKQVYPSAAVQPYHDKFVWAYLDADEAANTKPQATYGVSGIPHIEIVNAEGKSLAQQVGSSSPEAFVAKLDSALKAAAPATKK